MAAPSGDRVIVAAFMAVMIASGWTGAAGYDTSRDVAAALAIRNLDAFPLHGPALFASALHLGPLWFYVLALPLMLHPSWLAAALFVPALGSLQFPLAYAAGRRLVDHRFGLLWCAMLALPGWGSFELVGFAHTNVVPASVMLVLYTLVRLGQDRRPVWIVWAAGALSLATQVHPSPVAFAPIALVVAVRAVRAAGTLLRWGLVALVVAALPFVPLAIEQLIAPSPQLQQSGDYIQRMVRGANLAHLPALLFGILVRGPRIVADAFLASPPGLAVAVWTVTLGLELAAVAGLMFAWRQRRALMLIALAVAATVAVAVAWVRPVTPFYMTYALLPPFAGVGALGLHALCHRAGARGAMLCTASIGTLFALHIAMVVGIGHTIVSGHLTMPVVSRLDIKQDDPSPPVPEPSLAAYAVDASGAWLCARQGPVVLHATYAFLEDMYLGLDQRLHCGSRDVRLIGANPAHAAHYAGLAKPLWAALGWRAPLMIGGLGVAPVARVLGPREGYAVPDGSVYPPHQIATGPVRTAEMEASVPGNEALVVSVPYAIWTPAPTLRVRANGVAQSPLARDAISAVYVCRVCDAQSPVTWRIEIDAVAPERVDVITLAPPG
jgi:hypothetical protein